MSRIKTDTETGLEPRRVNRDVSAWMVSGLDARAAHLGISLQPLINLWIAERLEGRHVGQVSSMSPAAPARAAERGIPYQRLIREAIERAVRR